MSIFELLSAIRPEFDFRQSNDFFADGFLDSLDLITLVSDLEKSYGVPIDGMDIVPEHFCNIAAIETLLRKSGASL